MSFPNLSAMSMLILASGSSFPYGPYRKNLELTHLSRCPFWS